MCEHCENEEQKKKEIGKTLDERFKEYEGIKGAEKIYKELGDRPYEDLNGRKFGRLVAKKAVGREKTYGRVLWLCECECSRKIILAATTVKLSKVKSCGCMQTEKGKNLRDLTGQKFSELTVVERAEDHIEKDGRARVQWICSCSCGGTIIAKSHQLLKGIITRCDECNPRKRRVGHKLNLVGKKFGKWTVLAEAPQNKNRSGHTRWLCKCECGTVREVDGGHLTQLKSTSCGCSRKENTTAIDITNKKFGRWTVIERIGKDKKNNILWKCRCDCGAEGIKTAHALISGISTSCGCLKRDKAHARRENLVGQKFGRLTVIERAKDHIYPDGSHRPKYKCLCECGNEVVVTSNSLKNNSCRSCGCLQKERASKAKALNLIGQKFGKLKVVAKSDKRNRRNEILWECICECGNYVLKTTSALRNNKTTLKSCGCAFRERVREVCFKDLTGQRFGRLTVLRLAEPHEIKDKARGSHWVCQCDCGSITVTTVQNLHGNHTQSCGCLHREKVAAINFENLTGQKFGKLTVLGLSEQKTKDGLLLWDCLCECGHKTTARTSALRNHTKISCGCINSRGELKISNILKDGNIKFKKQMYYDDLRSEKGHHLRFDFYIPESNYLIEYDGEQHYLSSKRGWNTEKDLKRTRKRDEAKNEYCKEKGLPLIRIPYTHFKKLCLEDLLLETTKFRII